MARTRNLFEEKAQKAKESFADRMNEESSGEDSSGEDVPKGTNVIDILTGEFVTPRKDDNEDKDPIERDMGKNKDLIDRDTGNSKDPIQADTGTHKDPTERGTGNTLTEEQLDNDNKAIQALSHASQTRKAFGEDKKFNMAALMGGDISDRDPSYMSQRLFKYCQLFEELDRDSHPLHTPKRVYGYVWDELSIDDRYDLQEKVEDLYLTLKTDEREIFKPMLEEAQHLSRDKGTISDIMHMHKLHDLNSKEIPVDIKLTQSSTPMDLRSYMDAFERQVQRRYGWARCLKIKYKATKTGSTKKQWITLNVLKDFKRISLNQISSTNFERTKTLKEASSSMYEALQRSMSNAFKAHMRLHNKIIDNQGPRLLWFILTQLTINDQRVQADFMQEVYTFEDAFRATNYDVNLCCPVLFRRLLDFEAAGGKAQTYFGKIYTSLTSMHCDALNALVREWEHQQMQIHGKKCIFQLVQVFPSFVKKLIHDNTWPYHKDTTQLTFARHLPSKKLLKKEAAESASKNTKASKDMADITSFIGSISGDLSKLAHNAAIANRSTTTGGGGSGGGKSGGRGKRKSTGAPNGESPANRTRTGPYVYCPDRWGPNKFFKNEQSFKAFFEGRSGCDKNLIYNVDGTKWTWCDHCNRMGNHPTQKHRPYGPAASATVPVANTSQVTTPPVAGHVEPPVAAHTAAASIPPVYDADAQSVTDHLAHAYDNEFYGMD